MKSRIIIFITYVIAMCITVWPLPAAMQNWWPDFVFLTLIFWVLKRPYQAHLSLVFVLGLYMDLLTGTMLGQHALPYVITSYFIIRFASRLQFVALAQQMVVVLFLVLFNRLLQYFIMKIFGQWNGSGWYWFALVMSPLLWLVVQSVLKRIKVR